ncbi:hypothetical protein LEN26_011568 [Aphanomyces euteiches]|nr:hypothetical protein AeMF1_010244 [Aphanomyces euteiches]KAH9119610.1 hypothetical protein LEN26_011568 [Aphanomyces euteiches]KAH9192600.1 hypothetical protein AeNC1_005431 [Aphanomyces euteiches]
MTKVFTWNLYVASPTSKLKRICAFGHLVFCRFDVMKVAVLLAVLAAAVVARNEPTCAEAFDTCAGNQPCCNGLKCHVFRDGVAQCLEHDPKPKAKDAEESCTNVSVLGDATFCVRGVACGDNGDVCPKKGDVAVGDCVSTLKSYVEKAKCVAPSDAVCQKTPQGPRSCMFGAVQATNSTTNSTLNSTGTISFPNGTSKCSANWSQCNGQNWPLGVCCEDPKFTCNKKNDYLSLCEPKDFKRGNSGDGPENQAGDCDEGRGEAHTDPSQG